MKAKAFEYIRLAFDFGDLSAMNGLSSMGWKVVAIDRHSNNSDMLETSHFALMERELELS